MASVSTTFTTFASEARAGQMAGTVSWASPSSAQTSNNLRAALSGGNGGLPLSGYTPYLTAKQLSSLVPTGATIDGIKITLEKRQSASEGTTMSDSAVHIIKGGTVQTTQNKATATAYTTTDVAEVYGGATDKWGLSWLHTDVNGGGFGVGLSVTMDQVFDGVSMPEVDAMTVEVFYTAAVGGSGKMMMTGVGK